MATKKWPKWVVGFSSVASFTGFLFLIQHPMDVGKATVGADGNLTVDPVKAFESLESNKVPQLVPISVQSGTSAGAAKTFMRSRVEFQQISELSPVKKSERELLLEQLDWDGLADNATVIAEIKTTATPKVKSDVRTRRS
ncbi:MAG: hypothetical protein WD469_00270 [Paenibacillaceae bacterium]